MNKYDPEKMRLGPFDTEAFRTNVIACICAMPVREAGRLEIDVQGEYIHLSGVCLEVRGYLLGLMDGIKLGRIK